MSRLHFWKWIQFFHKSFGVKLHPQIYTTVLGTFLWLLGAIILISQNLVQ